ncbi:hypothetical protein GCM10010166_54300 [Couchioplanes caeruleus subsp. azureus]|nr:hypothetical protein GCM10010166_54300 [Couchioplanes caeruleus subsp. azureus]
MEKTMGFAVEAVSLRKASAVAAPTDAATAERSFDVGQRNGSRVTAIHVA